MEKQDFKAQCCYCGYKRLIPLIDPSYSNILGSQLKKKKRLAILLGLLKSHSSGSCNCNELEKRPCLQYAWVLFGKKKKFCHIDPESNEFKALIKDIKKEIKKEEKYEKD